MKRLLAALCVPVIAVSAAGCSSSGDSSGSSTSSASTVLEVPTNADTSAPALGSTSAPQPTDSALGPSAIELPPLTGLPVRTLPLPPGGVAVRDTQQPEDSTTQSYTVTAAGSTGADLATWYRTALTEAGFGVGEAGADGGFSWQGTGVTGTGAVSGDTFVLTIGPA